MEERKKIIRACTAAKSLYLIEEVLPKLKQQYEVLLLSSPGPGLNATCAKYGVKGFAINMAYINLQRLYVSFKTDQVVP